MPAIDPHGSKQPVGWQRVFDSYSEFRTISKKLGIVVGMWELSYKRFPLQFFLRYSDSSGKLTKIYLGSNSFEASKTIQNLMRSSKRALSNQGLHKGQSKLLTPQDIAERRERRKREIERVLDLRKWWTEEKDHPKDDWIWKTKKRSAETLMNAQAGILPMTMEAWLFVNPLSEIFPLPPTSQEEYRWMQREAQKRRLSS